MRSCRACPSRPPSTGKSHGLFPHARGTCIQFESEAEPPSHRCDRRRQPLEKKKKKKLDVRPWLGKGTQTRSTARMGAGASTRHAGFVEPESYKEHGTAEAAAREKVRKRSILAPCLRCKLSASVAGVVCRHLRMHARSTTERLQLLPILARLRPPMRTVIEIG